MRQAPASAAFPLISHAAETAVIAFRGGKPVSAARFISDVQHLAARLPDGDHVLNVCTDRYHFAVGLGAALVAKKISLLPSTHTAEVIRQLQSFAADAFCLTDDPTCDIALPRFAYPVEQRLPVPPWKIPCIESAQVAAYVFTSGSTGQPVPHAKTWGRLVHCVQNEAQRLGIRGIGAYTLIGTVPAQHMYGFESTVLLALQSASSFCAERPFYPADICAIIAAAPRPRALITTPIHLRALLAAELPLPALDLLVSATAHLPQDLARAAEARFQAPLQEIYGSTETGQIASRRTAMQTEWQLWPGVRLMATDGHTLAQGGHVETPTRINDVVELLDAGHFLLHGRSTDLVNIAGKRSSFDYLNHQLNAIEGVRDGAFFLRDAHADSQTGVSRLAALVVAPDLNSAALLQQLRKRIDPVFLPRPLLFVDSLPRNGTGKLPQGALLALAGTMLKSNGA